MAKPIVLTSIGYYLPGYKAGGPIRTLANTTECLGDEFSFFILTSDRDLKSDEPYPSIKPGVWQTVGKAQVMYLHAAKQNCWHWRHWLKRLDYDVLYLNSCFAKSTIQTLILRWLRLVLPKPVILAPRGEFSPGALSLKKRKKSLYMAFSKWMNLYKGIIWQASSEYERLDIINTMNDTNLQIIIAPNLVLSRSITTTVTFKESGSLKIAFLSRVARKKNLDYALQVLANVCGNIVFDIYGPLEDIAYWQECQSIIAQMPTNVKVSYLGEVPPDQVMGILSEYHLFFFPTRGENFGHVISESLRAGCPVLISEQTPWKGLEERKAGWVVPLEKTQQFQAALQTVLEMDNATFQEWSSGARAYGEQVANDPAVIEANRALFLTALRQNEQRIDM